MSGAQRKSKTDPPMEYKMNHRQRGSALIFNHENFGNPDMKKRRGTNQDRNILRDSFKDLGFDVHCHDNKKKTEVIEEIQKAAKANHKDADCFVCIFLSHGDEGEIEAYDDKIEIKKITDCFRGDECKSLVGKPKIFIFQACAGKKREVAVTGMMADDDDDDDKEVMEEAANIYTIPAGADFLMCYSVAPGFQAFRNTETGSYYIQDLCKLLQDYGSTMEFTELLTQVNLVVSQHVFFENEKQMPCFTSLLTKKLYFRPKK